jgi:predicted phosphodiesterase
VTQWQGFIDVVKIWTMSDLHYEILSPEATDDFPQPDADLLIIAGDYHRATKAVAHARRQFPDIPLVMIGGNHEHYRTNLSQSEGTKRMQADAASDMAAFGRITHVLENQAVIMSLAGEQVRIVAGTLWTDFDLFANAEAHARYAGGRMNDYNYILGNKVGSYDLLPAETLNWHRKTRGFIEGELRKPFNGKTVVVTHHLPSLQSVASRYRNDPLTAAFASNCDDLLELGADLWIHGHTHDPCDYVAGKTRVVCNPRGYATQWGKSLKPENLHFLNDLVVKI